MHKIGPSANNGTLEYVVVSVVLDGTAGSWENTSSFYLDLNIFV